MSPDVDRLAIVLYPDPVLRGRAAEVDPADETVRTVARRMVELMHEAGGVGLAAPQVGLPWRIFVTNAADADPVDRVYLNPVLHLGPDEGPDGSNALETMEEGCLSLPDIRGDVRRPRCARIEATGLDGERFEMADDDFLARVWQHEFDHLEGVLIIDKFGPLDRLAHRRALKELERDAAGG